jgi:hypothetical protein
MMMAVGMGLATRELALLRPTGYQTHRELALAAGILAAYYLVRAFIYAVEGPDGPAFTSMITIVMLVTVSFSMTALSNEQLINRLNERASRDGLTGLLNRTTFMEQAVREVRRLHAAGSLSTVILADLDNVKAINDAHGHAVGDAAIRAFAGACQASINLAAAEAPKGVRFPTVSYGIATTASGRPRRGDRRRGQCPLRGQEPRAEPDCHSPDRCGETLTRRGATGDALLSTPPCAVPLGAPRPGCRRRDA